MKKIEVKTESKSYEVLIGQNVFSQFVQDFNKPDFKILVVCDKNVYRLHRTRIDDLLNSKENFYFYSFNSTERNKNLKNTELIYKHLFKNNFSRKDAIVALGGGIVGDVAGFVAATYMRGISFYQVPTTLLSMVDSSVGGKTGVNFIEIKNLIGAFYQPEKVYADLNFLETLSPKEIISGAGEIFKYAFLADEENYLLIRNKLAKLLSEKKFDENLIARCIKLKAAVVENDEKELSGLRKVLNLGHTFAHAFESALKFQIKHGEAVIAGIFASLIVSEKLDIISKSDFQKYVSDFLFLPVNKKILNSDTDSVIEFMKSDKKTSDRKIKLVLASKPGNMLIDVFVDERLVKKSLKELFEIFRTV
ncbi:3-Dehydroquinate synthetase [Ignavibacterium album JCM 16511]|uniref:3-dehydroquinate synthase n=1 Tax=Ignavibacterium album (strain DSM 19864 / JCM 16511 / NBRC 101810 / Mat9-16) TaxID=945713 RepID=I0AHS5_IGNAJ|nr:3-dehydroquinate synthase [Ignavibacterium album]AFH48532.1 3-Dehydroquinate synthetase [Ignavibacterium album JCM 16511]